MPEGLVSERGTAPIARPRPVRDLWTVAEDSRRSLMTSTTKQMVKGGKRVARKTLDKVETEVMAA
ncbi:MAG TPA: hypothetical protein PKH96_00130, partial [Gemmatimonadaceae bacterium]|nr:hypothetical protein [Gemmatimonadaceae bacterium]